MTLPVEAVAKASLLLVLALAAAAALRNRSAALRHYVLAAGIVAAALLPAAARIVPAWSLSPHTAAAPPPDVSVDVMLGPRAPLASAARPAVRASQAPGDRRLSVSVLVRRAWIVGVCASLLILLAGFIHLTAIASRAAIVVGGPWRELLTPIAAEAGISRPITLLQSDHPSLLVTWGLSAPRIVLPLGADAWPRERIGIVLRHELAHIRRGDWLIQVVAELLRAAYWFNPIVWIACARMRQESEHACDDAVIGAGVDPAEYASHIVDLARAVRGPRQVWVPAHGMAAPGRLEERVSAMLNARLNRSPISRLGRLAVVAGIMSVAALVAGFGPQGGAVFSGTVVDALGRPLAGQRLTLTTAQSQETREATTDASGAFAFAPVAAGDYTVSAERFGFQKLEEPVTLAGDGVRRTITFQLATIEEKVRVTSAPAPPAPAPPAGKIGPPPAPSSPATWVELREKVRAKRATSPCATSPEGGCIQAPVKLRDVKPIYPESLKGSGIAGVVVLKGTVAGDGAIHGLEVVSSPHPDLSSAAIAAVGQWLFEPTSLDGTIIETPITIHVAFEP